MAVIFALEHLFTAVKARMDADTLAEDEEATPVPHVFGWREPAKHRASTHRIVWVPGDDRTGELGEVAPARNPGGNPRSLATVRELFTVYIEAQDPSAAENEATQYHATRLLFDAWVRAVYLAARGTYALSKPTWVIDKKERRHGAAIRVLGTIEAMVPDTQHEEVIAVAEIDVEMLDHEETMFVEGEP
jgi:hypothetical protein